MPTFEDLADELTRARQTLDQTLRTVNADRDLNNEARSRRVGEAQEAFRQARADIEARGRQLAESRRQELREAITKAGNLPPEARHARELAIAQAAPRVQSMLEAGRTVGDILNRAVEIGDLATVEALRREVHYTADDGGIDEAFARRAGGDPDTDRTTQLAAIERQMLDLLPPEEAKPRRELATVEAGAEWLEGKIEGGIGGAIRSRESGYEPPSTDSDDGGQSGAFQRSAFSVALGEAIAANRS